MTRTEPESWVCVNCGRATEPGERHIVKPGTKPRSSTGKLGECVAHLLHRLESGGIVVIVRD